LNLEALAQYRRQKKIKQAKIAVALGLKTPGGYSRIETGDVDFPTKKLPKLAEGLGISLKELLNILFFDFKCEKNSQKAARYKKTGS
jgi:transcriptional regulator with XRE-family HTH domain